MMEKILAIFAFLAIILFVSGVKVRYDNYRIYKVKAESVSDVKVLQDLESSSDSYIFLTSASKPQNFANIVVAPHKLDDFISVLQRNGINYEVVETNLQRQIDEEEFNGIQPRANDEFVWTKYYTLDRIYTWLRSLAEKYPQQVTTIVGGKSYENREILGVKVSYKEGNPGIFIEGGIHAREWISPATVTYILNQLLTSKDENVREIAVNYDWYIFPSVNPDGYAYTHERNRLWRKTRTPYGSCYGADPNRNWNFHWKEIGASSSNCAETYAGPSAFSEIEMETLAKYIATLKGKIQVYLAFHSYSQLLLFPYGHTSQHANNHDHLQQIGDATAAALAKRYGTRYTVGNTYDAIYPAAGASMDWAFGVVEVPVSYTYELRPNSNSIYGFELPADQIIPTGEETLDSVVTLIRETKKLGYFNNKIYY